jgi:A/G-specific adenine glycosylase
VTPYRVWISEIMLQQTQAPRVVPFFQRWMERLPDVASLAAAEPEELLKLWEGLGYYSRVKNIQRTARTLVAEYGGRLPRCREALLALPGIGPYTAAAVLSLGFNEPYAVLDANVARVVARLFDVALPVRSAKGQRVLTETAQRSLPAGRAREFNQALMELGALRCLPKRPQCASCPLLEACLARERGTLQERPVLAPAKPAVRVEAAAGLLVEEGRVFIQKRPAQGLMADLWEFPGGKIGSGETPEEALRRELLEELGLEVVVGEKIGRIRHSYTTFRVNLHVYWCRKKDRQGQVELRSAQEGRFVEAGELGQYAFPAANRKLVERLVSGSLSLPAE